jgi:hypothetical protein
VQVTAVAVVVGLEEEATAVVGLEEGTAVVGLAEEGATAVVGLEGEEEEEE